MKIGVNLNGAKQLKLKACGVGTAFIEFGGTSAFSSGDLVGFTERHATGARRYCKVVERLAIRSGKHL